MKSTQTWDKWRERAVYALLFALPVAGISVRHWISATFALLALLSLPEVFRRRHELLPPERRLLVIAAAFFAVFLVTAFANGWTEVQTRFLGREFRFLLLIPIYLMVRRYPDAGLWLVRGGVLGAFSICAQALYDVHVLGLLRAQGFYSPNLLGPFAAILAVFTLVLWRRIDRQRWFSYVAVFSIAAAFASVAMSTSRGALVGFVGMAVLWCLLNYSGRRLAVAALGVVVVVAVGYFGSPSLRDAVNRAASEVTNVLESGELDESAPLTSVPARLEMWRVSLLIYRDNPLFGVGRGNYTQAAKHYVERGLAHPEVATHSHPHNAYLEMMVSKGTIGLIVFLALLFYPFWFFWSTRHQAPATAQLGMLLITGFALFSLTDASTYIKGNFISIFLLYLTALFAWHTRHLNKSGR